MATLMEVDVLLELSARALAKVQYSREKKTEVADEVEKEFKELLAYKNSLYSSPVEDTDMQEGVKYLKSIIEKYTS